MPIIQFEYSLWLLPLYFLLALGLTFLLYSKQGPWSKTTQRVLFAVRLLLLTWLAVLLLNPLVNQYLEQVEKPTVVLAIDNSSSMTNGVDSLQLVQLQSDLGSLQSQLEEKNYQVDWVGLDNQSLDKNSLQFTEENTDLGAMLQEIQARYENTNLASVFLVSDGKFNRGSSPIYQTQQFDLHTIGVGDTIQKLDLELRTLRYNKVAYQGNRFPIIAEVYNYGFAGEETQIRVKKNSKVLKTETIRLQSKESLSRVELEVEASAKGLQRYTIELVALSGEAVIENNRRNIYIDVIDGKQKIALIAPAPHPDLKALRTVIEQNKNFEVHTFLPGQKPLPKEKFDLAIVHQAFDRYNRTQKELDELLAQSVPMFYILGPRSNLNALNKYVPGLTIDQKRNQRDQVVGQLNQGFGLFTLSDETNERWAEFVPVSVPYGDIQAPAKAQVLLNQKVGSVTIDKPLMFVQELDRSKMAVLLADGIWQWRLQEYALYEDTETFDDLFLKLIQYLSTKVDKRKFRCYPVENEFVTNQSVSFQAELYNEIYERVYGSEVVITIQSDEMPEKEFSFTPSSQYSELEITSLAAGSYQYRAETQLNGKRHTASGTFVVKDEQLEQLDQVADFTLLRQLASENQGHFYAFDSLAPLWSDLGQLDYKSRIHYQDQTFPVINLLWALILVLSLASLEWGGRKYSGGY
ncbi:VWA domain-containing protein [Reichenbachiella ulvae]|uniref:VWA domain-containing protein n=1 Tax=Reichenbachiella ulvae TaxID=2980104 RepID=A0ABT3D038_9BACT|nr:VWA domain-containing protein [Reichenbachiella ulvae]MCV9389322.1 VWA domain-containing protein [Reichenbachiella ulvae]